ncbi:MAG: transcription termination/antitermination protein NusG, partial [Alkaliphilus sp.]|nr:transcription termination/antitermination protein NusG [Alkaliphilus sp.]
KKVKQKKIFPGYVIVHMIMNDETWYVIRNTRGVTGFVGPGSKPIPLTDEEVKNMGIEAPVVTIDVAVADTVKVVSGPFESFIGTVKGINIEKHTMKVLISMFGRDTPVELDFGQVEKL